MRRRDAERFALLMSLPVTAGAAALTLLRAEPAALRALARPLALGAPAAALAAGAGVLGLTPRGGRSLLLPAVYRLALGRAGHPHRAQEGPRVSLGIVDAVVLGVVEGLTEFLPVSSTGHLTIAEGLLGLEVDDPAVTAFTAVIQSGADPGGAALLRQGHRPPRRRPARRPAARRAAHASRASGSRSASSSARSPSASSASALRDVIKGPVLRSLVTVGLALVLWSVVMVVAERRATQARGERDVTVRDTLVIGLVQCIALVPGVSRSGATISAGLLLGLDRVTATRLSFFLSVPGADRRRPARAVAARSARASGSCPCSSAASCPSSSRSPRSRSCCASWPRNSITAFVPYRVALGVVVLGVLGVQAL